MKNINNRNTCRWCQYCEVYGEFDSRKYAICNIDIRERVEVESESCCDFEYDKTFMRY